VGCGLSRAHIHSEVLVAHGNARTTVHGRKLIVARHRADWRQAHIAAAMGISRKCVRTWITRYQTEGEAGPPGEPAKLALSGPLRLLRAHLSGLNRAVLACRACLPTAASTG
jgi:transposase-like protein